MLLNGQLMEARKRCGLKLRHVVTHSEVLAQMLGSDKFRISRSWLSRVEAGRVTPNLHKLCTLHVIYRERLADLPGLCDANLEQIIQYQLGTPLPNTHLYNLDVTDLVAGDRQVNINLPADFAPLFDPNKTDLVARMAAERRAVPLAQLQQLDPGYYKYAFIGRNDHMMDPLLPPMSFVQIDTRERQIEEGPWPNDHARPVYFVKLKDRDFCCWCERRGKRLELVAYSQSDSHSETVSYPRDAEIIGRVTGVVTRLAGGLNLVIDAPRSERVDAKRHSEMLYDVARGHLDHAGFVARMVAEWGVLPLVLSRHLRLSDGQHGYIGLKDRMMHPRLRPGALVWIDERQRRIEGGPWPNKFARPIYLVELPDGYLCCWCELEGNRLKLVPFPASPSSRREVILGREGKIIGRVIGVATRLVDGLAVGFAGPTDQPATTLRAVPASVK